MLDLKGMWQTINKSGRTGSFSFVVSDHFDSGGAFFFPFPPHPPLHRTSHHFSTPANSGRTPLQVGTAIPFDFMDQGVPLHPALAC